MWTSLGLRSQQRRVPSVTPVGQGQRPHSRPCPIRDADLIVCSARAWPTCSDARHLTVPVRRGKQWARRSPARSRSKSTTLINGASTRVLGIPVGVVKQHGQPGALVLPATRRLGGRPSCQPRARGVAAGHRRCPWTGETARGLRAAPNVAPRLRHGFQRQLEQYTVTFRAFHVRSHICLPPVSLTDA